MPGPAATNVRISSTGGRIHAKAAVEPRGCRTVEVLQRGLSTGGTHTAHWRFPVSSNATTPRPTVPLRARNALQRSGAGSGTASGCLWANPIVRRALSAAIVRSPLGIARCWTARTLEAIVKTSASRRGLWTHLSAAAAGASRLIARAGAISRSRPEGHCTVPSAWVVLSTRSGDLGVHSSGAEHNQLPQREAPP